MGNSVGQLVTYGIFVVGFLCGVALIVWWGAKNLRAFRSS